MPLFNQNYSFQLKKKLDRCMHIMKPTKNNLKTVTQETLILFEL